MTFYLCRDRSNFVNTLFSLTGSPAHCQAVLDLPVKKNLSAGAIKSEHHVYLARQLDYVPPELRENQGEVEAAAKHELPALLELADIRGDLHCHTSETDGNFSLEEMVQAAREQGYEYVAITDHSQSLKITNGMDERRLLAQMEMIDQLNEKYPDINILKSMEIDILADGSLDLADEVLRQLDITVCSIHSKFSLPIEAQTERILRAMDHPCFNILGHATGRLLQHRSPYEIDMDRILVKARENNCFLEVNAQPARLDINDRYCKMAKAAGVKMAISSDAHTLGGFSFYAIGRQSGPPRLAYTPGCDQYPHLATIEKIVEEAMSCFRSYQEKSGLKTP